MSVRLVTIGPRWSNVYALGFNLIWQRRRHFDTAHMERALQTEREMYLETYGVAAAECPVEEVDKFFGPRGGRLTS